MVNLGLQIVFFFCGFSVAKAFLYGSKVNCLVTSWSEWNERNEYGQRIRRSSILRLPSGGGKPCPHTSEVKDEGCNCTSWSGWSGSFGFQQNSRYRTWIAGPRTSSNNSIAKMSSLPCSNTGEEDIRFTGIKPGLIRTAFLFSQSVILIDKYEKVPEYQIGQVRDIVLILDSSGSIGKTHFTRAKTDAMTLLSSLCPADEDKRPFDVLTSSQYQYHQLAMITYSTTVEENFFFNSYNKTENVLDAISKARYHGQYTNTAAAFVKAQDMFQRSRGARNVPSKVRNEVLILTDGLSNRGEDPVFAAHELSKVADVYGLMIGTFSAAGMEELTSYVSEPASKHLFNVEDFPTLSKLVALVEAMTECAGLDLK